MIGPAGSGTVRARRRDAARDRLGDLDDLGDVPEEGRHSDRGINRLDRADNVATRAFDLVGLEVGEEGVANTGWDDGF